MSEDEEDGEANGNEDGGEWSDGPLPDSSDDEDGRDWKSEGDVAALERQVEDDEEDEEEDDPEPPKKKAKGKKGGR